MSKVIVFGGTGWVGHHIVLDLAAHGYDVTVASRGKMSANYAVNPVNVRHIAVDKSDEAQMKELFAEKFDVVIDSVPTMASIALTFKYAGKLRHYIHCSSTGGYTPLPFIPCNETAHYHGDAGKGWANKALCDAEVMNLAGCRVALVETGFPNFKLTAPADMELLKICVKLGGADVQ